jgi:hypothetical protein
MNKAGRKFFCGFTATKDANGQPAGAAVIKLKPRNAYELLGLRRPPRPAFGKF